jgi:predicted XRE-type DNA-binding protein
MTTDRIEHGSGNVFADIGVPNPGLALAKAKLAAKILQVIQLKGLTQAAAGKALGIGQPKVSALMNGRLEGFSSDRLLRFLARLGCDVHISVSGPGPRVRGAVRVRAS